MLISVVSDLMVTQTKDSNKPKQLSAVKGPFICSGLVFFFQVKAKIRT